MQPCQRLGPSRRVPYQAAQAVGPVNAARNHPTPRQQDNASCRVFPPDDLQMHPLVPRRRSSIRGRVNTTTHRWDALRGGNHARTGRPHRKQPSWPQGQGRQQPATRAQCLCICGRAWRQMMRLAPRLR